MSSPLTSASVIPVNFLKRIAALCIVGASVLLLAIGLRSDSGNLSNRDFIAYWSAGQLLIHNQNPYSDTRVLNLEQKQGYKEAVASTMLNPPWAMIFVLPLGLVGAYPGALAWTLVVVTCIVISIRLLRIINGGQHTQDHLIAYAFAPVLACIMGAQMAAFACLGLVLFLYWRNTHPFGAGIAAVALTIKPHLFLLFFLILLIDCSRRRRFRTLYGVLLGVAIAIAIPLIFNHNLISEYLNRGRLGQVGEAFIPTVSFMLRLAIAENAFWIQFAPLAAAVIWAVWYYARNRDSWDWNQQGLLLLAVSVWVAPYSTFLDEVVLLPIVIAGISLTGQGRTVKRLALPIFFGLNVVAFALLLGQVPVMSGAYIWTTTAWLLWYFYVSAGPELQPVA